MERETMAEGNLGSQPKGGSLKAITVWARTSSGMQEGEPALSSVTRTGILMPTTLPFCQVMVL